MPKKQKDETPNVNAIPNRDIVQRLNFLYQASVYLQSIPVISGENTAEKGSADHTLVDQEHKAMSNKKRRKREHKNTSDLARTCIQTMKAVSQKATVKIDPSVKRSICSKCNTTLVLGSSANVRVKKSSAHRHVLVYTCLSCKTQRRLPAPPLPDASPSDKSSLDASENDKLPVPLAARRDAGHVAFCGNKQVEETPHGSGTCFI
ncbi:hypothetical protein CVT24_012730 [Panaeolus cyanescens]|uniref:Uncharacterized protein n=1 Tax=Panaeolus cyanescens TaxID=181874 RepID=A0A409WKQ8_9AGAR|nr:hypothetical protein CVT24_012730 [Panaeolus cyanescens]